ncbi:1-phosphofructokinase family hexose kinase [Kibdelosporangium philippinense]|uniref:1-phosphofructokinase family hexose kinase n=1 Tax=Kibdelosporangium philippinense TaxID=211113 RepID=A0ABS8ZBL3_9PSEU|nr:1-phosphofructokinase family hexose kinase [Kibdelosporangium philippinense]MCE7004076.1 1-phosphofructokinase family hexose kinase [Kibdelosporangium philippinense]
MIVTVTLNAALDVTYRVDALAPGATHRVTDVRTRPGGKGVNVAAVLTQLGEPVTSTGFAGPELGARLPGFVPIAAESRRTVTVVAHEATVFTEPGPLIGDGEWRALLTRFDRLAAQARVVVLSGSLPPGLPDEAYARLIERCPVPVVLDTDGTALRHGITAGPALVKPNVDELTRLLGRKPDLPADCVSLGVPVAATLGAQGAVLATPDGVWRARPPAAVVGNPTGAGDAFTAALARGVAQQRPWPEVLADAVALSAAAVLSPVAGVYDAAAYQEFAGQVRVEEG